MWLMTTRGFYSAVQHRKDPDTLLIRARDREDLERLQELAKAVDAPEIEIVKTERADYLYRAYVKRDVWQILTTALVNEVEYPNFKNAVKDAQGHERANVYMKVWSALLRLERRAKKVFQPRLPNGRFGKRHSARDCNCEGGNSMDYIHHRIGCPYGDDLEAEAMA